MQHIVHVVALACIVYSMAMLADTVLRVVDSIWLTPYTVSCARRGDTGFQCLWAPVQHPQPGAN